ncbi:MAG TPA: FAD-dependent monooxygenase [Burkholderiales bacterium]|nr:FAD-dependent monooxygenase [Burkholderiales bacterium]
MAEQPVWTGGYELPVYPFVPPPELAGGAKRRYPIVIVGGGLSGLTLGCDLANRGVDCVLLDEDDTIGVRGASSRGIAYAQKTLEIFAHLGTYPRVRDKGVTWSKGKTLAGNDVVYSFDLQSASASEQPPFINLQQFYVEWFLVDRIRELGRCDLRWKNRVTKVENREGFVAVSVETPAGAYTLEADWLVDATGVNSVIRRGFGLETHTAQSADRWCITDVRFKEKFPAERWTWVEAPFNENRAVWQHLMGDDVWRLDYQMDPDCDPDHVSRREVAEERLRAHLGDVGFELVWVGPYAYRDHLLDNFRHGCVFVIGDAAHVVSPFGARGGNSGVQDAYNLGWKLALVLAGRAPEALLDTYDAERQPAARQNLEVTRRTNRFLTPRSSAERTLRDAVIGLARECPFARSLVNSGRLSVANPYPDSPAVTNGGCSIQNVAITLPDGTRSNLVELAQRSGTVFIGILYAPTRADDVAAYAWLEASGRPFRFFFCGSGGIGDPDGKLKQALGAAPGSFALIRPDLYLAGCVPDARPAQADAMLRRALCRAQTFD